MPQLLNIVERSYNKWIMLLKYCIVSSFQNAFQLKLLMSGRPRARWEDNIRIALKDIGVDRRNWVLIWQKIRILMNATLNFGVYIYV